MHIIYMGNVFQIALISAINITEELHFLFV